MSWTRSAAARTGLAGAVGATLVLSTLPSLATTSTSDPSSSIDVDHSAAPLTVASGDLPITWPPTAEDIAAVESTRDAARASRAQDRAELAEEAKEQAEKEAAEKEAAQKAAAEEKAREAQAASRAAEREAAPSEVVGERWTTVGLNIRSAPNGSVVATVAPGTAVSVTNRTDGSWQQVRWDGQDRWVAGQYLSQSKPAPAQTTPQSQAAAPTQPSQPTQPSTGACAHGGSIESGLTANARGVYRAVCNRWPQITGYGGYRPDGGYHGSGRAVDVMVSGQLGWDVANWVRANAGSLGVSEVIYSQRIWTVQRSGEGWRWMSDRGSNTANHYDHVHISVY